jgi:adenylate kinase family enzyme
LALTQTLWIGGGTSAGKTSIARALAERYGLTPYHVDEHELEHARRRDRSRDPAMEAWNARSLDEIWVELPVPDLVEATLSYSRERIELITEDLRALSAGRVVVAEGFELTPEVVAPLIEGPRQAVWLLPRHRFRRETLLTTPQAWAMPSRTSDPERAQAHRIERDALLVECVREQALVRSLRVIDVDGTRTVDEVRAAVEEHFEPYLQKRRWP